jgi:hypothetical protein
LKQLKLQLQPAMPTSSRTFVYASIVSSRD